MYSLVKDINLQFNLNPALTLFLLFVDDTGRWLGQRFVVDDPHQQLHNHVQMELLGRYRKTRWTRWLKHWRHFFYGTIFRLLVA